MRRKWLKRASIASGILFVLVVFVMLSGVHVLAASGVDAWQAYQKALQAGLQGLKEYFNFIIELFKAA